jgi:hypothetical protein
MGFLSGSLALTVRQTLVNVTDPTDQALQIECLVSAVSITQLFDTGAAPGFKDWSPKFFLLSSPTHKALSPAEVPGFVRISWVVWSRLGVRTPGPPGQRRLCLDSR